MKNKEFLDFIRDQEPAPLNLKMSVQKDILLSLRWRSILARFIFLQTIGAMFSLAICPQFGVGLMQGHGIAHFFKSFGDLACASFCGSIFLSFGALMALLAMKGEELWWVWRHFKLTLVLLPAVFWTALMLANKSMNLPAETVMFNIVWVAVGSMLQIFWIRLRSGIYLKNAFQY